MSSFHGNKFPWLSSFHSPLTAAPYGKWIQDHICLFSPLSNFLVNQMGKQSEFTITNKCPTWVTVTEPLRGLMHLVANETISFITFSIPAPRPLIVWMRLQMGDLFTEAFYGSYLNTNFSHFHTFFPIAIRNLWRAVNILILGYHGIHQEIFMSWEGGFPSIPPCLETPSHQMDRNSSPPFPITCAPNQ